MDGRGWAAGPVAAAPAMITAAASPPSASIARSKRFDMTSSTSHTFVCGKAHTGCVIPPHGAARHTHGTLDHSTCTQAKGAQGEPSLVAGYEGPRYQ
jgi:hypothetical protein